MLSEDRAENPDGPKGSEVLTAQIGPNIAHYRRLRGIKASELARRTNVSASLISQIERGRAKPSVGTLVLIAGVLDVPLDAFIGARDGASALPPTRPNNQQPMTGPAPGRSRDRFVVRHSDRATIRLSGGVRWERLMPDSFTEDVYFAIFAFPPGTESNAELYTHGGADMLLVTQGELCVYLAFERYVLEVGDSICFESVLPHRYANESDLEARAVSVVLSGRAWASMQSEEKAEPARLPAEDPEVLPLR
jgi:transcriptional regulator with XRE-family HTH domain